MQARAFNRILIQHEKKQVIKSSTSSLKLQDEINYYLNLPLKIAHFFPRLLGYREDFTAYTLEYIPYKSLADLIVENEISFEEGKEILSKLFEILDDIHFIKSQNSISLKDIQNFYIKKTRERIENLKQVSAFQGLTEVSTININNKPYQTFQSLQEYFANAIHQYILQQAHTTMIHGDFCFSNILYCPKTKDIKLIDPRGSFVQHGIYGDPDYDYAKLLHCLHGNYDYIVNNNYDLQELDANSFIFHWPSSLFLNRLHSHYQKFCDMRGINSEFFYLIEASLFLSMAALHYECQKRQKALFLMGLIILNNFFEGNYENLH